MSARKDGGPIRRFSDPRVEIFEPTGTSPYYRIRGFDDADRRVVDTTGGRTLREAQAKAAAVTRQLRAGRTRGTTRDPRRVDVRAEAGAVVGPGQPPHP